MVETTQSGLVNDPIIDRLEDQIRALPGVKILLDERANVYRCRLGSLHFRAPFGKTRNGRAIGGKCMPPGQGSRFENQMNYGHPHKRMNRADSETPG
jgi:hypothetical protein